MKTILPIIFHLVILTQFTNTVAQPEQYFLEGKEFLEDEMYDSAFMRFNLAMGLAFNEGNRDFAITIGNLVNDAYRTYLNKLHAERNRADSLKKLAETRLYRSLAQSLAAKSSELNETSDTLKGLLALQAHKFNQQNKGDDYDNLIYQALLSALKAFKGDDFHQLTYKKDQDSIRHKDAVRALASMPDGNSFFSSGSDGKLIYWQYHRDSIASSLIPLQGLQKPITRSIAICSDGCHILQGNHNSSAIRLVEIESQKSHIIEGIKQAADKLIFIPGKHEALAILDRKNIYLIEIETSDRRIIYGPHPNIEDLVFNTSTNQIFFCDAQGAIFQVDLNSEAKDSKLFLNHKEKEGHFSALAISKDNRWLAAGDKKGKIWLWDLQNNALEILSGETGQSSNISTLAFSPDLAYLASTSYDGSTLLYYLKKGDIKKRIPIRLKGNHDWALSATFVPGKHHLITGYKDGNILVWPIHISLMVDEIKKTLGDKYLSFEQWDTYIGQANVDYPYER